MPLKILLQSPKILLTIVREYWWLQKFVIKNGFNLVISDNRFGLHTQKVPCIFITHQLVIKAPFGWLQRLIQLINYQFIINFTACWVPDYEQGDTIAAALSHPKHLPGLPVKYIGPLTRFLPMHALDEKYEWLAIMSGPEPQRTVLEKKILAAASGIRGNILMVRGKPGDGGDIEVPANITVANHLSTKQMQQAFAASKYIISRCGYTTVMEVLSLQKKSILIPTPGQTEQEYLAGHLLKQRWCYCCQQHDDLPLHFEIAKTFEYKPSPLFDASLLAQAVKEAVDS